METAQIAQRPHIIERTESADDAGNGMALLGIIIAAVCGGVVGVGIGFALASLI